MEDPEDEMCIAALFEEEPKVQGPNAAGNTSSKSGEASTGDSTVNDALVSVEDISLGKLLVARRRLTATPLSGCRRPWPLQ